MATIPCFHVDAFTAKPFAGNPAVVCLLEKTRSATWMQKMAAEMNLSETAFVAPTQRGFSLRWFTPKVEVALCGHATLATAHVLWSEGIAPLRQPLTFRTKSGALIANRRDASIELDFPARKGRLYAAPAGLVRALGARPRAVARAGEDLLVEMSNEGAVRKLTPDMHKLAAIRTRGVIATAAADGRKFDFVSRFFAPAVGVSEDPVTGSAHCALAPWWGKRLDKTVMTGYQASERGGAVEVELAGDRVLLRGAAVTVVRGELIDG